MKAFLRLLAILTVMALPFSPGLLRAQDSPPPDAQQGDNSGAGDDQDVSFQTFYDQLGDQGTWIQTDDYGYVFQPNVSDPDWAPYTDGSWVDSPAGYCWVSTEPWGWATYHYGRWCNINGTGWCWVPGYRWAPAWVSWRYGGGYCGWAPLPPATFVGAEFYGGGGISVGFGFHFGGDCDTAFGIGAGCYNFIPIAQFGAPNCRAFIVNRYNNYTVINNTTNITNININKSVDNNNGHFFRGVSAGGPPLNEVNAHSEHPIRTVNFTPSNHPGPNTLQGNSLAVYSPRVNPETLHSARPSHVDQTISHPTFNRGADISKPLDVTRNVKPPPPSPEIVHAAQDAQMHAPPSAKIHTANSPVHAGIDRPLSSMQPVVKPTAHAGGNNAPGGVNEHPNTGNPENKPATTYHPENQAPAQTFHPENKPENKPPATTYHPENQAPAQTYHPENKPATTYHPENQAPAQTYHPENKPENKPPATTYHPENQAPPQTFHPQNNPPPANHPQNQAPPQTFHPQSQGGGGNQGGGNHPQGGGGGGDKHPQGGNEKEKDKKNGQ